MMNINNENELHENLEDEIGEENDEEAPFDNNVEVPSTFTNMEGTNLNIDDNWIVSQSTSKNDFIRELGKDSFKDKEELVRAIKIHCIRTHRQFEVIDSRPTILTLRCKLYLQSGCKWKLHASKRKRSGYFEITTYTGPHTCLHYKLSQDHPNLDASLIAMETRHLIKAQPSISIPALRVEIVETLGYTPSYKKNHVVKDREGICLISDRHGGILKAVNEHGSPWLEPRGFHRYCLRHFINNFYDKFRNSELKALAYRAGSQNQIRKFNSIMEEIGKLNPHARHWLESHPLNRWTLAYDGGRRYGLLTTNLSEIFNSVLKGARFLPITACVQLTFYRMVHYFEVRRPLGSSSQANGDAHTPHVIAKQVALMAKASAHSLRSFNREKGIFELITQRGRNVQVVNLEQKTCTCGKWEAFKYPCSHVLSACAKLSLNSWQYVDKCYSIVYYCATWASEFSPLPHEAYWPQSPFNALLPNLELLRNKKGRPRSTRLKNGMDIKEGRNATLCGICRQPGHNRKRCPSKPR
ncbi:unnamed protein product [Lactuca virosa]|uniref:SWIM-type domain-containing protein n=1 Tax=Lactuca virosa TaxID=75947 RepID=A0AAU9MRZ9_9ASTR|nr:unnamed protein product [Lactuca virosa]